MKLINLKIGLLTILLFLPQALFASDYLIGTYYFPGWTKNAPGHIYPDPWVSILPFPERKPYLGWYSDSQPGTLEKQVSMMKSNGLDFLVFDWYWNGKKPFLDHAVEAFKTLPEKKKIKYAVMWANHFKFPGGIDEYRNMVRYWASNYFSDKNYLTIDGRPVVFIFGMDYLDKTASAFKISTKELIMLSNSLARESLGSDIYFVADTPAIEYWTNNVAPKAGFSALSAYNYHFGYSGDPASISQRARTYSQLSQNYQQNWDWILAHSKLPYIMPMTSGWDKRPWGGSDDYRAIATPSEFETHLRAAKTRMDAYPAKTLRMGVICCWNEFGEGSFIEPTQSKGSAILEVIQRVFH